MKRNSRFAFALAFLVSTGAVADIEGLKLRLDKDDRDEPIESWIVFEKGDDVLYVRCKAKATECTRDSGDEDVAERRQVTRKTWLAEVARTYGLDARVLWNAPASAKRIDASVEALKALESNKEVATEEERQEARKKLAALTKKDGYLDRFKQAQALTKALAKPMGDGTNLVLEESDRRSYRTLWPFNFDGKAVTDTAASASAVDVVTGLRWTALKGKKSTWALASAYCREADAGVVPTTEQMAVAAAWIGAGALGKVLKDAGGVLRAWASTGNSSKVDPVWNGGEPRPTATGVERKAYHWFDGRFDLFEFDAALSTGGTALVHTPGEKMYPTFVQKQTTGYIIKTYDELVDPTSEAVVEKLGAKTTPYGVLCVKKRPSR